MITRRRFIAGATAATAVAAVGAYKLRSSTSGVLLSAFEDERGDQYIGGLSLDRGFVFGARVPMRAHGCAVDPLDPQRVVFFARRPGARAFELNLESMRVRTAFTTPAGRHLAGHGVFSRQGDLLFTPEHDYENARGVIAVREARTFAIVREIDTHGLDPHEIAWGFSSAHLGATDARTLLVANGGIMTHPRTYRRKLNVATMDPSLCAIDAATGECLEQLRLPDHLLSIRHLAVARDGRAALGLQYEGEKGGAPGVVALYRPGTGLQLLHAPAQDSTRLNGYVASISLSESEDLIAAACPYGAGVACWSLRDGQWLGFAESQDVYGVSQLADGVIAASRRDGGAVLLGPNGRSRRVSFDSARPIRWDDHWITAPSGLRIPAQNLA